MNEMKTHLSVSFRLETHDTVLHMGYQLIEVFMPTKQ